MLRHLRVTNFAILSDVTVELGTGFNVLTGETGAGKSLLVEAVNLLRGGRASADIPREGAKEAVVEAIFTPPEDLRAHIDALIDSAGLPAGDENEIVVRRVIQRGGRSRTYINGALTTARRLAEIGAMLVDLSSQHQHQGLVDNARHREILDAFAANGKLTAAMTAAYDELRRTEQALTAAMQEGRNAGEQADYLRFQLDELEATAPTPGEDTTLVAERARLQAVDRLEAATHTALELVYAGDDAAVDRLAVAGRELDRLIESDPDLAAIATQLEEARAIAEEAASNLRDYGRHLDHNPARLAEVDERLVDLDKLKRKHGGSLDSAIARATELRAELDAIDNYDEHLSARQAAHKSAESAARAAATQLNRSRKRAATRLGKEVGAALAELGMSRAKIEAHVVDAALGPHGGDRVEFLLAANPGEAAKPLTKIASGGELSRIMLALKLVLRRADEVATYVFDEVDAGVGGAIAEVVGRQIRSVADQRQVLCITHLAQIAVFADRHFLVNKIERDGRTETLVAELAATPRREETARMLGGARLTKRARAHADEMLAGARR